MLCTLSRVLSEVAISARGYDPLPFARSFNLHAKTETMTVLLHAFVSHEHRLTKLTRVYALNS